MLTVKRGKIEKETREKWWNKSLDDKIEKSKEIIQEALEKYGDDMLIAWTGGKDSTLILYLIKEICEEEGYSKPPALFVDHAQHFDEVYEFVEKWKKEWGFDVITARNDDLIDNAEEPGEDVPVEVLNERNKKELERLGWEKDTVPFLMDTEAGNHLLKTVATDMEIEKRNFKAMMVGIRWDEQEARSDEIFFSPRENPDHTRIHPILPFKERDVWEASFKLDVPINPLYEKGYRSLGSKVSTEKPGDKPAWEQNLEDTKERQGRAQDKEEIMKRLRELGYM